MDNDQPTKQYSLNKIVGLWALVAFPMVFFRFVLMPMLVPIVSIHPGILYWLLMIIGMIWQFILSVVLLKRELGELTWAKLKQRLWLNHPIHPKSLNVSKRLYLLTIPVIIYTFIFESSGLFSFVEEGINKLYPFLLPAEYMQLENLADSVFTGAWYLIGILVVHCLFNYLLGEELFFRGILLPKMNGVFGKWDWLMNGILFATYHLHKISAIPVFIIGSLFIGFLNKRHRSFWPSIIIHGIEAIPLAIIVLLVVSGLK